MKIEDNKQAYDTMQNYINSTENRIRSIYNYGFKDGYKKGLEDATQKIIQKCLSEMEKGVLNGGVEE